MLSLLSTLSVAGLLVSGTNASPTAIVKRDNPTNPTTLGGTWSAAQGGCWNDLVDYVRALEHQVGSFSDLTVESCLNMCDGLGFNLAGVEYSRECFCGNTIMGYNRPNPDICTMPCLGNAGEVCGGADAIYIYARNDYQYTIGPASPLASYNGYSQTNCYFDQASDRLLTGSPLLEIPGDMMTVERCIDGCNAAGYNTAGVEYGRECYCGDMSSISAEVEKIDECNMPCDGNGSEYCGGPNRIFVYQQNTN